MKRLRATWHKLMRQHKVATVAVIVSIGIVLLGGGYAVWSVAVWSNYQASYKNEQQRFKDAFNAAMASDQSEEEERKIAELEGVASTEWKFSCTESVLFDWQSIFGFVQSNKDDCIHTAQKVEAAHNALVSVAAYLDDEQSIVEVFASADSQTVVTEATLAEQKDTWQAIQENVHNLQVSEAFEPVKEIATEASDEIYSIWQQLFDAHINQDQPAYEAARAKLAEAYDRLAAIAPAGTRYLAPLVDELQITYDTI